MKKRRIAQAALLTAYCVPFAFLAVSGDAAFGTMLFYAVLLLGFALLGWLALKTGSPALLFPGSLLSSACSCVAAKLTGLAPMGEYFKPLTSYSLIAAISIAAVAIHGVAALLLTKRKRAGVRRMNGSFPQMDGKI